MGQFFEPTFLGEAVVPLGSFLIEGKIKHIFLSFNEDCIILRLVVLTQYRRVTDGQTDGRALRRAVKMKDIYVRV